jgi:hypothetical protein
MSRVSATSASPDASLAITFPMLVVVATFCLLWRSLSV